MEIIDQITNVFQELFGSAPAHIVRAPGRVNLLGEHVDYNDGFVLPMAIDRAVFIALRPRRDEYVLVHSLDFDGVTDFSLFELAHLGDHWGEYVKGVAWAMQEAGMALRGWEGGNEPIPGAVCSGRAIPVHTPDRDRHGVSL